MTEREIYKKAIEIAVNNGFNFGLSSTYAKEDVIDFLVYDNEQPDEFSVIFNHHFARAFFGTTPICLTCGKSEFDSGESFDGEVTEYNPHCKNCGVDMVDQAEFGKNDGTTLPAFLYHLSEMVQWQKPILYLEQFLPNPKGLTV